MPSIPEYDDQVNRERISAIADLYYIYQHERLGVFRAVLKLQDLFRSGSVRLSDFALYPTGSSRGLSQGLWIYRYGSARWC